MKYFKSLLIIALATVTLAACNNKSNKDSMQNDQDNMSQNDGNHAMNNDNMNDDEMNNNKTIVEVASNNDDLSTLVKALQSAGRVQMLDSEGPYTVFAPTNDAFDALPQGTMDKLMKPANKQKLTNILKNHVVQGSVMASDLKDGQTVTTVGGQKLTVSKNNGTVKINGAKVTKANVKASNGVIHVINKVLMPNK